MTIDNTKCSHNVSGVNIALVRTTIVTVNGEKVIRVMKEKVGTPGTHKGGQKNQNLILHIPVNTPNEILEKHPFNTSDGSQHFGSLIAPSY